MSKKYTEEFALNELRRYFGLLGRVPTIMDFKQYNIKPEKTYFINRYGGIEKACFLLGLIDNPLSKEERINISIEELKEIANKLNRVPTLNEYEKMKNKGYSICPLKDSLNMNYTEICDKFLFEYKLNIPEGYKKCSVCKEIKPLNEYSNSRISSCRLCEFIKRNDLIIPNNWTKEDCLIVIDNILNEKILFINDLVKILPHKTLDDFIDLLSYRIKIGNKPLNIKTYCSHCGKEEIKVLSVFINNKNYFCSSDCYWSYKREFEPKGENSNLYNRIKTKCTNCNKDIEVIPANFNLTNNNGDNHNFCSQKCYWEYRSIYYIGENNYNFGMKMSDDQKTKLRLITTKQYSDGIFKRLTKPQIIVNSILDELEIINQKEYNCKYYSIDNFLSEHNLMIEVMGDYFHANPLKFEEINKMQFKDIIRDKRKRTYIKKYKDNINILYLWEDDINKNSELIKKLILHYIYNNGIIQYYDSFNYSLVNNQLVVKDILIKPYINYTAKELHLIEKENNLLDKVLSF